MSKKILDWELRANATHIECLHIQTDTYYEPIVIHKTDVDGVFEHGDRMVKVESQKWGDLLLWESYQSFTRRLLLEVPCSTRVCKHVEDEIDDGRDIGGRTITGA